MRKATLMLVSLAIALTACGSSNKTGATSDTNVATGDTTAAGQTTPAAVANEGNGSQYCAMSKSYQNQSNEITNAFKGIDYSNPQKAQKQLADAFKTLTPKYKKIFADAIAVAPSEIKADLQLLGSGFLKFLDAFEKAGYDFSKLGQDSSITKLYQDPKFLAAADRVGKYGAAKCGIAYTPLPAAS